MLLLSKLIIAAAVVLHCNDVLTQATGSNFYLGLYRNWIGSQSNPSIVITTTESQPVSYSIEIPGIGYYHNGTITANNEDIVDLPRSVEVLSRDDQDKGIYLKASSDRVTVIVQNARDPSTDTLLALPIGNLCIEEYTYYGLSVAMNAVNVDRFLSSILIVGTENNTMMNLTVTQPVTIKVDDTDTNLTSGRQYSFVINRLQTVYVRSLGDLTGTKIVTNKPVSVFSGHECALIPQTVFGCDYLIEQVPPTISWGRVYYTAPLATRRSYTIRVLAAYNSTNVDIYCNDTRRSYRINEGEFVNRTLVLLEHCVIYANKNVLVAQFSHGQNDDEINGDPMMTLVPATIHYSNEFSFSTIRNQLRLDYNHYVNIIVLAEYYQPDMIHLISGGVNKSLDTQEWVPFKVNNVTEAYATMVNVSEGVVEVIHTNTSAQMTTIVYGFDHSVAYGHPGGLFTGCSCPSPNITTHPLSDVVNLSTNKHNLSLTCETDGALSYDWERQNGSIPSGAIGVNTNTLIIINLQPKDAGNYRCVATNGCAKNYSVYAAVIINVSLPVLTTLPSSQSVNLTQNTTFTCSANGYNVSYKWTIGSGSFPSKVTGINTNTLVIPDVRSSDDNIYTCVASNEGGSVSSNGAKLIVTGLPEVTVTPSSQSGEATNTAIFNAIASGVGVENFMYQWRHNGTIITDERNDTLIITDLLPSDTGVYDCQVTNEYGDSNVSEALLTVTVTVPLITTHPIDDDFSLFESNLNLSLTCDAIGATSYNWERQNGSIPSGVIGVNTNTLTIVNLQPEDAGNYRCVASNTNGSTVSQYATISVDVQQPVLQAPPSSQSVDVAQTATFTCSATGYNVSYKWTIGSGSFPSKVIGINTNTLVIPDVRASDDNTYTCVASNEGGSVSSNGAKLTVTGLPEVIVTPSSQSVEVTHTATFTTTARGVGVENFMYQWRHNGIIITDESNDTLVITDLLPSDTGVYDCQVTNEYGDSNISEALLSVTVTPPVIATHPLDNSILLYTNDFNVSLTCEADGATSYNWERQNGSIPSGAIGVNTNTFTVINLQPEDTGNYRCVATNASGSSESNFSMLLVNVAIPVFTEDVMNATIPATDNASFVCSGQAYGDANISWYRIQNGREVSLQDKAFITNTFTPDLIISIVNIPNVLESDEGRYHCRISSSAGQNTSNPAWLTITVDPPRIETDPMDVLIEYGKPVTITCKAFSYVSVSFTWSHNGITLDENDSLKFAMNQSDAHVYTSTLMIVNVHPANSGDYMCNATNREGSTLSNATTLSVIVPPTITQHPRSVIINEMGSTSLSCDATSNASSTITFSWEKFDNTTNTWGLVTGASVNMMVITFGNIQQDDEGVYRCIAGDSVGTTPSNPATVTVYGPPKIISLSTNFTTVEGSIASIVCNVSNDQDAVGTQNVTILWFHGNGSRVNSDGFTTIVNSSEKGYDISTLTFRPVKHTHSGHYTCQATNHDTLKDTQATYLIVEFIPIVTINPLDMSTMNVTVDESFELTCKVDSYPSALVHWEENDVKVTDSSHVAELSVTVNSTVLGASIEYTCVAESVVGGMNHSVRISVVINIKGKDANTQTSDSGSDAGVIVAIVLAVLVAMGIIITLCVLLIVLLLRKMKKRSNTQLREKYLTNDVELLDKKMIDPTSVDQINEQPKD